MSKLTNRQKSDLENLDLDSGQISVIQSILINTPPTMNLIGLKKAIKELEQAQRTISQIASSDVRFYDEIAEQLSKKIDWNESLLGELASTLDEVVTHQNGIYVKEVNLVTHEEVTKAVTPKSKNYYRYQALTDFWKQNGFILKLSKDSDFFIFLTRCLEGKFSFAASNRTRSHYLRYYCGIKVDNQVSSNQSESINFSIEKKSKSGDKNSVLEVNVAPLYVGFLSKDIATLKKKRN
jgi:hypothetical protein